MTSRTTEEVKAANIAEMGEQLGEVYSALWQELTILHFDWHEYTELFGTKAARIDLMNQSAPHFFRLVQDRLWETTLLNLARLTDPVVSPGKDERKNLTIKALSDLIEDTKLKDQVTGLIENVVKLTEFARDWRNRHIGHRDLKLALQQPTTPLAEGSRLDVKNALAAIATTLNALEGHYHHSYTAYDYVSPIGGAVSLLYVLGIGGRARNDREKRLEAGEQTPEDLVIYDI